MPNRDFISVVFLHEFWNQSFLSVSNRHFQRADFNCFCMFVTVSMLVCIWVFVCVFNILYVVLCLKTRCTVGDVAESGGV